MGRKGKSGTHRIQIPLLSGHFSPFLIVTSPLAQLQEKHKKSFRSLSLRFFHNVITEEIRGYWLLLAAPQAPTSVNKRGGICEGVRVCDVWLN